jgi:ATP-dependent Lon protease
VLAVGGIREKVIAARRVGIRELVLPEANRKDFEELPDYLREGLTVYFASRYEEVFEVVFG